MSNIAVIQYCSSEKNVLAHVRGAEQNTVLFSVLFSSFLFSSSSLLSQHRGNLILDLRYQDLGQHNASNLENSSSHFRLQNRLSVAVKSVWASQGPSEHCCNVNLAYQGDACLKIRLCEAPTRLFRVTLNNYKLIFLEF